MEFETPKGTMRFRPEDHQALQSMYHFRTEIQDGKDYGVPVLVRELGIEDMDIPVRNDRGRPVRGGRRSAAAPFVIPPIQQNRKARAMHDPILETSGLTARFGGHVAVDAVSCAFRVGELTAIVGPNGAGKTTYFNLISGQVAATAGRVTLAGTDITRQSVSQRCRAGLGRAFQLTNLFPRLSVLENVRLVVQAMAPGGWACCRWPPATPP